jgi:hypothetical protein
VPARGRRKRCLLSVLRNFAAQSGGPAGLTVEMSEGVSQATVRNRRR